jgi:branched-chain amino acid transport system substrate-binding protein
LRNPCIAVLVAIAAALNLGVEAAQAQIKIGIAGPLTGQNQYVGEEQQTGAQKAVDHINGNGGVLGQQLVVVSVDDGCDPKQAEAAARHLVSEGVVFVVGGVCSGSSIPASKIYQPAGIINISPGATNPKFTDEGGPAILRVIGRDDQQGMIAGDYLADNYANSRIAILNDGQIYGLGLAQETKRQLNKRGVAEVMFESYAPSQPDYAQLVEKLVNAKVNVLYVGGYEADIGIIIRQAKQRLPDLQLISGDSLATNDFLIVAGKAGEGARFTFGPDVRLKPEAAPVVAAFTADGYDPGGYTLYSYAAVQVWAEAVKQAASLKSADVISALHKGKFDTVLGTIGFDEKGDVTGVTNFVWYVTGKDGFAPVK